jgi:cytidylate kinase
VNARVIAVDGPGGVGKGTLCTMLAARLGWHLLDSGAIYRALALAAIQAGVDLEDEAALSDLARDFDVSFDVTPDGVARTRLNGTDISAAIRSEECSRTASAIAPLPGVRAALGSRQRGFEAPPGLVADGRDMGTVIFPDAGLKVFLTATVEERALRRYKQLKDKGIDVSLPALSRDMTERDRRDSERSAAPLRAADDARVLDTTELGIEAVIETVMSWAKEVWPDCADA